MGTKTPEGKRPDDDEPMPPDDDEKPADEQPADPNAPPKTETRTLRP